MSDTQEYVTYNVTLTIKVKAGYHPSKWMPEAICNTLEDGEDLLDYDFEEVEDSAEEVDPSKYEVQECDGGFVAVYAYDTLMLSATTREGAEAEALEYFNDVYKEKNTSENI